MGEYNTTGKVKTLVGNWQEEAVRQAAGGSAIKVRASWRRVLCKGNCRRCRSTHTLLMPAH
jgi:hypothetical protein